VGGNHLLAYLTYSAPIPASLMPVYVNGKEVTHYGVILTAWGSGSKLKGTYTAVWRVHIWGWLYYSKSIVTDKYQKNWSEAYVYFY
jgi:hypothetical protein